MKTLHRIMYENLTTEEYKLFCRIPKECFKPGAFNPEMFHRKQPSWCFARAFNLEEASIKLDVPFWRFTDIFNRLYDKERGL